MGIEPDKESLTKRELKQMSMAIWNQYRMRSQSVMILAVLALCWGMGRVDAQPLVGAWLKIKGALAPDVFGSDQR